MTKDRSIFSSFGMAKAKRLTRLCTLMDEKKIDYDTRDLGKMSISQINKEIVKITGKPLQRGGGERGSHLYDSANAPGDITV